MKPKNKKDACQGAQKYDSCADYTLPVGAAQRSQLLSLLRSAPQSTFDLRLKGVPHPAGRVCELRALGHPITSTKVFRTDAAGIKHRVALYVLGGQP